MRAGWTALALAGWLGGLGALAGDPAATPPETVLGSVHIDAATRSLWMTGHVNQVSGLIEYLACGSEGKTHESMLVVDARPVDIHAGLLLLGLKPGGGLVGQGGEGGGDPQGPIVDLWIEWEDAGTSHRVPAERLILNRRTSTVLPVTGWVFTGSQIVDGAYMAQSEHSLVATFWDAWAILNIASDVGRSDDVLVAYENDLPLLQHPIVLRCTVRETDAP